MLRNKFRYFSLIFLDTLSSRHATFGTLCDNINFIFLILFVTLPHLRWPQYGIIEKGVLRTVATWPLSTWPYWLINGMVEAGY